MNPFNRIGRWPFILIGSLAFLLPQLIGRPPFGSFVFGAYFSVDPIEKYFSWAAEVVLALLSGARLVDAGYRRWVGITSTFFISVGVPLGAIVAAVWFGVNHYVFQMAPAILLASTALLAGFLLLVGALPSKTLAPRVAIEK
jgi:hypothetical protein